MVCCSLREKYYYFCYFFSAICLLRLISKQLIDPSSRARPEATDEDGVKVADYLWIGKSLNYLSAGLISIRYTAIRFISQIMPMTYFVIARARARDVYTRLCYFQPAAEDSSSS